MTEVGARGERVVAGYFSDREIYRQETLENRDDNYVVTLPLCRGQATLRCEGGIIYDGDVRPGMLRVFAPGERVHLVRRSRAEAAVLTVDGTWFRRLADESGYCPPPGCLTGVEPVLRPSADVARLALSLTSAGAVDPAQRPLFVEGITHALLALTFGRAGAAPSEADPNKGLSDAEFARCVDYADDRIAERVDLAIWAAVLGMAAGEFTRRFRQRTGMAPYAWLLDWRVTRAQQLLARGDVPLTAIALTVGFSSQSHFTDAFRRRTGLPPGRWRSLARLTPSGGR